MHRGITLKIVVAFAALATVPLVPPTGAWAHDIELTDEEAQCVSRVAEALRKDGSGAGEDRVLRAVRRSSGEFARSHHETLSHLAGEPFQNIPEARIRRDLMHFFRALCYLRKHGDTLGEPEAIAVDMTSGDPRQWARAVEMLARQEFGPGLSRIASEMVLDSRPEVRFGAGILAKLLAAFRGADTSSEAIARNLLVDGDPDVACTFGRTYARHFRSTSVMDLLVRRTGDRRAGTGQPRVLFDSDREVVGEVFARIVRGIRTDRLSLGGTPAGESSADPASRDDLVRWWEGAKGSWPFDPGPPAWRREIDTILNAEIGSPAEATAEVKGVKWRVLIEDCVTLFNSAGSPRVKSTVRFARLLEGKEDAVRIGSLSDELAHTHRVRTGTHVLEYTLAPSLEERRIRVRLQVWGPAGTR